jgi:RteC protein
MAPKVRWIVSIKIKPFDGLYAELENGLRVVGRGDRGPDAYMQGIALIRDSIDKLREPALKHLKKETGEIEFFRKVLPAFYAKLLLYTWLYKFELTRGLVAAEDWAILIEREKRRTAVYFRKHRIFWEYYRSGAVVIDQQFTRAYSRGSLFDPLAMLVDPEFATLASYRAAQGLACEEYLEFLKEEGRMGADPGDGLDIPVYEFEGSDAEGQEWLMELFASKVIRKKGGEHLNLSEMNRWFKANFGREFNKFFDKLNVLRNRKIDPLRFLNKRMRATEQWMAKKNGKG